MIPSHPNLVKFIGICLEPLVSVVDLCSQGNMQKFLANPKIIEERVKSKFILDIAKGMLHLHSQSRPVLHRNLNSTNVLLKEIDSQPTAVISDFGITKSKNADKGEDSFKWMVREFCNSEIN
jgi:serine/threonine protein kinase